MLVAVRLYKTVAINVGVNERQYSFDLEPATWLPLKCLQAQ
jgi:hypothetical protein